MSGIWTRVAGLLLCACVSLAAQTPKPKVPLFKHVFVLVEENQSYRDVVGNTQDMPYLNSLIDKYGLATNYFADTHPSINNYFYLTSGRKGTSAVFFGLSADLYPFDVDGPNIASVLTAHGATWKSYAESLPHAGYIGGNHGAYAKRHNPFAYYETVRRNKKQRQNIVPFKQLQSDLKDHKLPDYGFLVPNVYDDGHNNPPNAGQGVAGCDDHAALQHSDQWLQKNIGPLIDSPEFQDSLLIITYDEGCDTGRHTDKRLGPHGPDEGGGHVATVLVSPRIAPGTRLDKLYHPESVLRLSLEALGVYQGFPGNAAHAAEMSEFFTRKAAPKVAVKSGR